LSSSEFRQIVRISGKDLDGTKKVIVALSDLKGLGYNLANALVNTLRIDNKTRLGALSDRQLAEIEDVIRDVSKLKLPPYLLNRRKDLETGLNKHLIGSEIDFMLKSDLDRERNVMSWRGIRHSLGLKVRGQRTRTTGRKGRTVGVRKTAAQAAARAAAAQSQPAVGAVETKK
jgi:small subunit ribosomal protein S13